MMASRLFWKVFCAYSALTLLAAFVLVAVFSYHERVLVKRQVCNELQNAAIFLSRDPGELFSGSNADLY